jgi:hypothetical protein
MLRALLTQAKRRGDTLYITWVILSDDTIVFTRGPVEYTRVQGETVPQFLARVRDVEKPIKDAKLIEFTFPEVDVTLQLQGMM